MKTLGLIRAAFPFGFLLCGLLFPFTSTISEAKSAIYPEIVRLSYVQGDVRFSREDYGPHQLWEQAAENLPILQGWSMVTGNGRAEIEFEDGSVLYLAENSALQFETLITTRGVPFTQVGLITGTATVSFHPVRKEVFRIATPTDTLQLDAADLSRVDSYLDAAVGTVQGKDKIEVTKWSRGKVLYHGYGPPVQVGKSASSEGPVDWDKWVAARVKQREEDTAAALQASGLVSFIPGLTDLYTGGTFSPCAPFGVCWEPQEPPPAPPQTQQRETKPSPASKSSSLDYYYPLATCPPTLVDNVEVRDPAWSWALCHSGSWVYLRGRYRFVVGKKRHHPPVHWVRTGKENAYVPRHPNDVKGRPPLNLKYGVFEAAPARDGFFEHRYLDPAEKYRVLAKAPKQLREVPYPHLAKVERPEISARLLAPVRVSGKPGPGPVVTNSNAPIHFDYKTGNFVQFGSHVVGNGGGGGGGGRVVGSLGGHGGYSGGFGAGAGGGSSSGGHEGGRGSSGIASASSVGGGVSGGGGHR